MSHHAGETPRVGHDAARSSVSGLVERALYTLATVSASARMPFWISAGATVSLVAAAAASDSSTGAPRTCSITSDNVLGRQRFQITAKPLHRLVDGVGLQQHQFAGLGGVQSGFGRLGGAVDLDNLLGPRGRLQSLAEQSRRSRPRCGRDGSGPRRGSRGRTPRPAVRPGE